MPINPTRINLINTKKSIALAKKGHGLLKKKREVLVAEFMKLLKLSGADRSYMDKLLTKSYSTVAIASAYEGEFALSTAVQNAEDTDNISINVKNVMGVRVPEISYSNVQANMLHVLTSSSTAVGDIMNSFTDTKKTIIEVAKREQGLRRVVIAIDKTKRRVNALENVVVPRLEGQARYIKMRIEEMDRDTFSALKHVKARLEKKK